MVKKEKRDYYKIELSYNAVMNMIDVYASSKAFCLDRETECETNEEFDDLDNNPNYQYYYGRAEMAETWLQVCGISPESNIVQDKINNYLQYKED